MKKCWSFTVTNNGLNPVPYVRVTRNQIFTGNNKQFERYVEFKSKILGAFTDKYKAHPDSIFELGKKYYVVTMIYFKKLDGKRGDPDNINKGVLDSIFTGFIDDNWVAGVYDFDEDSHNPRIEVKIYEGKNIKIEILED